MITEPVGSCTDLAATVIEPLRHLHGDRYEVAPLAVLLKPSTAAKSCEMRSGRASRPRPRTSSSKQLEEADVIALNKIDKLSSDQQEELLGLLAERFPGKTTLAVSARDGAGFERLVPLLEKTRATRSAMPMDYDTYAEGEAELGWLNCQAEIDASHNDALFSLDEMVLEIVRRVGARLDRRGAETAHLKVLGQQGDSPAIANLVGRDAAPELSLESGVDVRQADVVINARVAADPIDLEQCVREAVAELAADRGWESRIVGLQRFRPGRPEPTHRLG